MKKVLNRLFRALWNAVLTIVLVFGFILIIDMVEMLI